MDEDTVQDDKVDKITILKQQKEIAVQGLTEISEGLWEGTTAHEMAEETLDKIRAVSSDG